MRPSRRLTVAALALLPLLTTPAAHAQDGQPVRLIVGYAAGGPVDQAARLFAPLLVGREQLYFLMWLAGASPASPAPSQAVEPSGVKPCLWQIQIPTRPRATHHPGTQQWRQSTCAHPAASPWPPWPCCPC